MKKYKYKTLVSNTLIYDMDLDKLGEEGWNLVSFSTLYEPKRYVYLFKLEYD